MESDLANVECCVQELAGRLEVWPRVRAAVHRFTTGREAEKMLAALSGLPVRRSHATRILGSYVYRGDEPLCIRLQFAQEPELLKETFLHELAHACDHLTQDAAVPYQQKHGPRWKRWAIALGTDGEARGTSKNLSRLYRSRLKPVGVCRRCGTVIQRVRKLNQRQTYRHRDCGGRITTL